MLPIVRTPLVKVWLGLLILGLAAAACTPAATPAPTPAPAPTSAPPTAVEPTAAEPAADEPTSAPEATAVGPASLALAEDEALGRFLADADGRTLYLFTNDTPGTSTCYEGCAAAWPALLTEGEPSLGEGLSADLLGTTERTDGTTQLTYNGWPLYYYTPDQQPGDTTGQAVGEVWWVVSGEGNPIKPAALQIVENDALGRFLADGAGRTLYLFTNDMADTSACFEGCAAAWPPLLTIGEPALGEGLAADLLGTTERPDGSTQLTYNGWPLYYYTPDLAPGDVNGQAVGDVWWVVSGEGHPIKPAALQVVENETLGRFLTDGAGRTLYLFTNDTPGTTNCFEGCAAAWPPLLTVGEPSLAEGLSADLLGATTRLDGSSQLTYNGWPLYYYAADQAPGDVNGQGVGEVWYVISPEGEMLAQ